MLWRFDCSRNVVDQLIRGARGVYPRLGWLPTMGAHQLRPERMRANSSVTRLAGSTKKSNSA